VASEEERNARLDDLATKTREWAEKERESLKKQASFAKRLLKGRTGAERLNNASVTTAQDYLVAEIDQFLSGQ
jgi:hypothetical protein